jgi:hypothetical protein
LPVAAENGLAAALQFFHREKFLGGTSHNEGQRVVRCGGGEACKDLVASLIGEKKLPAEAVAIAIQRGRSRRSNFQAIAVAANKGASADVTLDQSFRFELGIRVGHGGAMDAQNLRQFAAGGNAITGTQVTGMNEGAQLVAELNIKGDMAFGLKV